MSRHVAIIGRTTLRHLSVHPAAAATPPIRAVGPIVSVPRHLAARPLRNPSTNQLRLRTLSTFRNAAATDSRLVWPGSSAPVAAQLGLTKGAARPSWAASAIGRRLQEWPLQSRRFSEKAAPEQGKITQTARISSAQPQSSTEIAKGAQKHATAGTAGKSLLDRISHIHRPTKYELLAAATGFWERLRIHFKWFSIRSLRPFTVDEIGAFVSWIFLGHILWIIIGTTTFVSLAIWAVNTVFAQETLAGWVGNYLTKSSGVKVVFESAIVPTWSSGVITFNNVFVSRRPGKQAKRQRAVSKGSLTSAAAAAAAEAALAEKSTDPQDDGNYTQFDVTIDSVNVTLSFSKWFNGTGLLQNVQINGVRGVIDRTHVQQSQVRVDPRTYRREHKPGDFEIDEFKMSDVLLTVHQPNNFRPFTVSVFSCELPRLRKQWLFYDIMCANNMSGSFDDSLFTIHPRQLHGLTGAQLTSEGVDADEAGIWKKHSRLRIDGINIDHLNRGVEGTFSWIREGNVDIVADVMIPADEEGVWQQSWQKSTRAMSHFYEKVEATVTNAQAQGRMPEAHTSEALEAQGEAGADKRFIVMDINVHLNDVRASVPIFTRDLSYVNNALVRPIVAYINSRRAFIPVTCRVVKRQGEFDGSWTVFDSGLMDDLSREVYDAVARDVQDVHARNRRIKKVGLWTISLAAQALFVGLAGQLA